MEISIIASNYQDLIDFADRTMRKRNRHFLFTAVDVVHEVFLDTHDVPITLRRLRKKIIALIFKGVINRCSLISFDEDIVDHKFIEVFGPLDEKRCTKCLKFKYVIYDFRKIVDKKAGFDFFYYDSRCKTCNKEEHDFYRHRYKRNNETVAAWNKKQSDELTDYYIRKHIVKNKKRNGINIGPDDVSQAEIDETRIRLLRIRTGLISTQETRKVDQNARRNTVIEKNKADRDSLTDAYIRKVIQAREWHKGNKISQKQITDQQVAITRQAIIKKRINQVNKRENPPPD